MQKTALEISVGLFIIFGIVALAFLALKVSGLTNFNAGGFYTLNAEFDNVGDLKIRAPVTLAGVRVGEVKAISLDSSDYRAKVVLSVDDQTKLPTDTSASIYTQGLLGSNYIGLSPGYNTVYFKNNGTIENTSPALILEKLIGQLLFSVKGKN